MTKSHPEAEGEPPDELGRNKLTVTRRIELLERDRAQQSRMITEIVGKVQRGFSDEQVAQIRHAFREELANAGLRLDDGQSQDEARRDFMFVRSLRRGVNGAATKIGWLIIVAIAGGVFAVIQIGINAWRSG